MRILLVIVALLALYSPAHALQCYHATDWSNQTVKTDFQSCDKGVITCVRPRFINGAYVKADPQNPLDVIWGCGKCAAAESCITPTNDSDSSQAVKFGCVKQSGEGENKFTPFTFTCDDREFTYPNTSVVTIRAETRCHRPRIGLDGNYMTGDDATWGCGECPDPLRSDSCVSCNGNYCNTERYSCFNNEAGSDENKNIICGDTVVTDPDASVVTIRPETSCHRPRIDLDGNFMTGDDATWGCGECPQGSNSCVSCDGLNCNHEDFWKYTCLNFMKSDDNIWMTDNVTTKIVCKTEKENDWSCKMPTPDNKAVKWNPCGLNCGNDGQCKVCYGNTCNDLDDSHWCKVGPADSDKPESLPSKFCDRNGCLRPRVEYGKLVDHARNYSCADDDNNDCYPETCAHCDSGNDCNKDWPVNIHKCYVWSWVIDKYVAGELRDCNRWDAVHARCNMPLDIRNKTAYTPVSNDNGCGKCSAAQSSGCITTFAEDNKPPTNYSCYSWS